MNVFTAVTWLHKVHSISNKAVEALDMQQLQGLADKLDFKLLARLKKIISGLLLVVIGVRLLSWQYTDDHFLSKWDIVHTEVKEAFSFMDFKKIFDEMISILKKDF